jgi:hypothetical protein
MSWFAGVDRRSKSGAQQFFRFGDPDTAPVSFEVFTPHEASSEHAIEIHRASQVIDLVLEDARIPALRMNRDRLGSFVQAIDAHRERTRNDRCKSRQAQAAFEEFNRCRRVIDGQDRIDDGVRRDWFSHARGKLIGGNPGRVFGAIFNYGELEIHPDLWRRQTHSRSGAHSLEHGGDQILDGWAHNFGGQQLTRRLAEDTFAGLEQLEQHRLSLRRALNTTEVQILTFRKSGNFVRRAVVICLLRPTRPAGSY